jgi:hypothetical protein
MVLEIDLGGFRDDRPHPVRVQRTSSSSAFDGYTAQPGPRMHGSDPYRNELLFDRRTATDVPVPAPRAFEDTLIVYFAFVDASNPHRHPALRAKRAPIRHLKRRATVALQRHASSPTGRSAPPLGL